MNNIETAVAQHYGDAGLLARIIAGLEAAGADVTRLRPEDLAPVEEFHIGGRKATAYAVGKLAPTEDQHVLDIGCGIGGAARYIASQTGCRVTGIDLTPEYVAIAKTLTDLTGLQERVGFETANALLMPFASASFDAAITLHAAMNIAERATLYREIARVLKPGAKLCIFDVMKKGSEGLQFPVPWAATPDTSFLTSPDEMGVLLENAGFQVEEVEDRTAFAIDFFQAAIEAASNGPPALGIHLVMGPSAHEKFRNTFSNIRQGRIAPVQIIARRPG